MQDPAKREFAEELISYTDKWTATVYTSFKGDPVKEAGESFYFFSFSIISPSIPYWESKYSLG